MIFGAIPVKKKTGNVTPEITAQDYRLNDPVMNLSQSPRL